MALTPQYIGTPKSATVAFSTANPNRNGTGTLATFDPTTLRNGAYWIELIGTNTAGLNQTNTVLVTVQGDLKLGRVLATTTDLKVPAPGLAIKIERTYDSLNRSRKGALKLLGVLVLAHFFLGSVEFSLRKYACL